MRFSQRIGQTPAVKVAQRECMDSELRNALWSLLTIFYWEKYQCPSRNSFGRSDNIAGSNMGKLFYSLWLHFFKQPVDTIPRYFEHGHKLLREHFFKFNWFEVYDFIEFVPSHCTVVDSSEFYSTTNTYLERENSAYRFVNGSILEITSEQEIIEIENALESLQQFSAPREHLTTALTLLSNRTAPDYRNSIKESISAIESLACAITNRPSSTLGDLLKELESTKSIHPALKKAYSALYGYTSDGDGIRHALTDESNLTKADARFMLISCSAFLNYIINMQSNGNA